MDAATGLILAGALAGGFINGLAGFGTALFALGFLLQALPPLQAVAVVLVMSVSTSLPGLWVVRHAIRDTRRRLVRFLLPGLAGIPLGVSALAFVDTTLLKLLIAGFMILYGAFFLLRRTLPRFDRPTPVADIGIGFASGILGGLAGLSGALPAMWCAMRPWPRHETRAVMQPFNFAILLISAVTLGFRGAYTADLLPKLIFAVIVAGLAAQAGIFVFKRLTDIQFRWLLIALMFASGLLLLGRTLG